MTDEIEKTPEAPESAPVVQEGIDRSEVMAGAVLQLFDHAKASVEEAVKTSYAVLLTVLKVSGIDLQDAGEKLREALHLEHTNGQVAATPPQVAEEPAVA